MIDIEKKYIQIVRNKWNEHPKFIFGYAVGGKINCPGQLAPTPTLPTKRMNLCNQETAEIELNYEYN